MCGIAGYIDQNGMNPLWLKKMALLIKHRGPDDEGYILFDKNFDQYVLKGEDTIDELINLPHINSFSDKENLYLGFAHRRLSILDLSSSGHQPMQYQDGRYSIILNGEIYNYLEIKEELISKGYVFKSTSDTEVVLTAYNEWGKECVNRFTGMWAFAIFDKKQGILFLSRDRFGIKPLYFAFQRDKFAFASEIKALLSLEWIEPKVSLDSLAEFLVYGNTSDPSGNLFKEVHTLPEGHNMIVNLSSLSFNIYRYYNLKEKVRQVECSKKNQILLFRELFENSVNIHLRSDVPVGVNLSGGLDSSSIVAFMAKKLKSISFKTFTAAYHYKNIDESGFARMVANHYPNTEPHFTYPDIQVFWNELEKQIWHHDLPFHSTSMFAQWEVMKLANKNGSKVLLNGQGSDEMLGGYYNFAGLYLILLGIQFKWARFLHEYRYLKKNFTPTVNQAVFRAAYGFLPGFVKKSARKNYRLGSTFVSNAYDDLVQSVKPPDFHSTNYEDLSIKSVNYGLQQLLRYEDRISMAFSIESRVPFLDHRLVEFAIALKPSWKIKDGWTKYILRKSSEPFLPEDVVWRKDKMGFLTPAKEWKQELNSQIEDYIRNQNLLPFFDKNTILKTLKEDLVAPTHLSEFWKTLVIQKWVEVFDVSI